MTGTFRLQIELGNDAMQSRNDILVALKNVAIRIIGGEDDGKIMDENGNTVGNFKITED
ncbi:MAG: hypothetical protein AABZ39_09010 [Spirochaetota bacterium]